MLKCNKITVENCFSHMNMIQNIHTHLIVYDKYFFEVKLFMKLAILFILLVMFTSSLDMGGLFPCKYLSMTRFLFMNYEFAHSLTIWTGMRAYFLYNVVYQKCPFLYVTELFELLPHQIYITCVQFTLLHKSNFMLVLFVVYDNHDF